MKDEWYRATAIRQVEDDKRIAVDSDAEVASDEDGAWVQVRMWVSRSDVGMIIRSLQDLAYHVCADYEEDDNIETIEKRISRRLYKDTDSGIGFCMHGHQRFDYEAKEWIHVGPPTGVSVAGYCEGDVGECESYALDFPFLAAEFDRCIEQADQDSNAMWDATHGCEFCGEEDEFGNRAVNPECPECKGHGIVI